MVKLSSLTGAAALVLTLASCGQSSTSPAEELPAVAVEGSSATAQGRQEVLPLPTSDYIAEEVIKAVDDPSRVQFFPPKVEETFPGGVRVAPDVKSVLRPPSNATTLQITAVLEPDAWIHQREYKTDGIAIIVDSIDASGVSLGKQELVIDPTVNKQQDAAPGLNASISSSADRLELMFSARGNGALDNTTVVFAYK
jgi:hypothetical protein